MFKKIMPLNAVNDSALLLMQTHDWQFTRGELLVPLVFYEMAEAAREYPLVFLKEKGVFYALLGFEQGVNAYLAEDGHWRAHYIPARLRAFPFALAAAQESPDRFAVVADADSSLLNTQTGDPLFINGVPGPTLETKIALLKSLQTAEPTTVSMVSAIRDAGLLSDRGIQVKKPNTEHPAISGFQVIDEQKLNNLTDAEFNKLRKIGALPLVYAHLLSMANLRQGIIAGKYPELANKNELDDSCPASMDDFLGSLLN